LFTLIGGSIALRWLTKEKSRLPAGPSLALLQSELAILIGVLGRIWLLTLTAWILLLLAGLLPAALLLAGLLARVLVLLTRVLILSAHSGISLGCLNRRQQRRRALVAREHPFQGAHSVAFVWRQRGGGNRAQN
jgi:hypothetical protein